MTPQYDVVIVSSTYPSSNPRVIKEADALHSAGIRVALVFSQGDMPRGRVDDQGLLQSKDWAAFPVKWSKAANVEGLRYIKSSLRFHLARRLPVAAERIPLIAAIAEGRTYPELSRAAARIPARLYIGHYPDGLAAAAHAAIQNDARLAYDVEDLHTAEDLPTKAGRRRSIRVGHIERRHLPRCAYVSVVSEGIGQAMVQRYGVCEPLVVHNVFPLSDRSTIDGAKMDRRGGGTSFYWYSQVVGPDRGIEDAVRALALTEGDFELHVRGTWSTEMERHFRKLAADGGIDGRLFLHPPVTSDELLSRTAEHDVGLALERLTPLNRGLTVTNKFFFYMLAGLAVVASDTPGQAGIARTIPDAVDLYKPGNVQALARIFKRLLSDPELLRRRKEASLSAVRESWNWETESKSLVRRVSEVLSDRA